MKIIARAKALLAAVCAAVGFTVLATPQDDAIAAFRTEVGAAWDAAAAVGVPDAGFSVACDGYTDKQSFIDDQASDYIDEDLPAAMIDDYRMLYVLQLNKCTAIGGAAKAVDEALGQLTDPSQAIKDIAQNAKNGINALYAGINGYSTADDAKAAAEAISGPAIAQIKQAPWDAALAAFKTDVGAAWDAALTAGVTAERIAVVCEGYTDKAKFLADYEESAKDEKEIFTIDYINGQKAAYVGELNRLAAIAEAKKALGEAWDEAAAAGVDFAATKDNWDGCTTKEAFLANFEESAIDEKEIFTPEYIGKQIASYKWFFKMEAGAAALGKAWDKAAAAGVDFEATKDDWEGCTTKADFLDNFRESAKDDQEYFTPEVIQEQVEYYQWLFELESGVAALEKAWDAAAVAGVDFEATKDLWEGCTTKADFIENFRESARDEDFPTELIQAQVRYYVQQLGKAALDAAWDKAAAAGVNFEATQDNWDGCTTKAAFLDNFDGSIADEPDYFTTGVIQATVDNYLRLFAMESGKVALDAAWDAAETAGVDFEATKDNWDGCTTKDAFIENFEESVKGEPEIFTPAYIQATVDNYLSLFAMETAKAEIATAWDRAAAAGVDFEATKDTWEGCTDKASFLENFEGMLEGASVDEIKAQAAFYVAELNRLAAIEEGKAALDAAWDKAAAASVDFEKTKDNWEGCTTKDAFIENFVESAEGEKDIFTAEYIKAVVDNYLQLFDRAIAEARAAAMEEALRDLATKWDVAEGVGVDFEATKDDWEGCTTKEDFLENFAGMFTDEETATQIKAQAAGYLDKLDALINDKLLAKYDCLIIVGNGSKFVGEADPKSLVTNFTVVVKGETYTADDFGGYCKRAAGEAPGTYAINFVSTRLPDGFAEEKLGVQAGIFTIEMSESPFVANGTVTAPKAVKDSEFLRSNANATWKAKADTGSVFMGWTAAPDAPAAVSELLASVDPQKLAKNSLTLKIPAGAEIRPTDVIAVWKRIDEDVPAGKVPVMIWCDATMGKVTGTGLYALGKDGTKKVSINATANRDFVFAGWYEDQGFSKPVAFWTGSGKNLKQRDYRETSQSITVSEPTYLYARFVAKTTKADAIGWLRYAGAGYCGADASWLAETETWYQGVPLPTNACAIAFGSASLPTVTVSGLPSGVKFDKQALRFTGVPTAASTEKKPFFTVKVSVKNKSGATDVLTKNVRVEPLPAWAVGNFDGFHIDAGETNGTFTATVGKTGKLSGKTAGGLASTTFSAASFSGVTLDADGALVYVADVTVKYKDPSDKKSVQRVDTIYLMADSETGLGVIGGGDVKGNGCIGVQRAWDRKDLALPAFPSGSKALSQTTPEGITLKFGTKGKVTVAGTVDGVKVSGTSYALAKAWRSTMTPALLVQLPVYVAPKKGLEEGFCKVYDVLLTVDESEKFASADLLQ